MTDARLLTMLLQLAAQVPENNPDITHAACYGAAMFICAFSEKLLRELFFNHYRDKRYIPTKQATLGQTLNSNNSYMTEVFGEYNIKNLSFFLQQTSSAKMGQDVGQNIRNNLSH